MMGTFEKLLKTVIVNPSIKIGNIIEVDNSAYLELNNTTKVYPQFSLHNLLTKQALITPLNEAIKFGDSKISLKVITLCSLASS